MSVLTVFSGASVVAKRNLIKIKRVPELLIFTTLQPIMFVLLFAYVFGSAISPDGVDYASSSSRGSSPRRSSSGRRSPARGSPTTCRRA
jgi:hypothetical protein